MTDRLRDGPGCPVETPADDDGAVRTVVVDVPPRSNGPGHSADRERPDADELYLATRRSDPVAAEQYAEAQAAMPEVGDTFLGFRLEAELGRGAFGRVFLARQGELADRPVAL